MLSSRRRGCARPDGIPLSGCGARAKGAQSLPGNGAPLPSIDGGGGDGGAAKAARTMPHKSATLVCFSTDTAMKGCASASAWIWGSGHGRRSVLLHTTIAAPCPSARKWSATYSARGRSSDASHTTRLSCTATLCGGAPLTWRSIGRSMPSAAARVRSASTRALPPTPLSPNTSTCGGPPSAESAGAQASSEPPEGVGRGRSAAKFSSDSPQTSSLSPSTVISGIVPKFLRWWE
mmetsp:Transcript_31777/g.101651  ORF Transcript_31777/g.101651 Transcript_31777/m.101651 type:complete len:234 (+) Transcript_31777:235-936(+)